MLLLLCCCCCRAAALDAPRGCHVTRLMREAAAMECCERGKGRGQQRSGGEGGNSGKRVHACVCVCDARKSYSQVGPAAVYMRSGGWLAVAAGRAPSSVNLEDLQTIRFGRDQASAARRCMRVPPLSRCPLSLSFCPPPCPPLSPTRLLELDDQPPVVLGQLVPEHVLQHVDALAAAAWCRGVQGGRGARRWVAALNAWLSGGQQAGQARPGQAASCAWPRSLLT